ncbi:MAG: hypothetical protein IJT97_10405 [Bacteroidaceae bacterium]|nr:hypothetical protein [Bacteroidaceae bacterium]
MKKTYMQPLTEVVNIKAENLIQASVTGVGGNTGITKGEGTAPGTADSKSRGDYDYEDEPTFGDLW